MKIAANTWIWISPFSPKIIKKVKALGFDGIEIPVENPAGMNTTLIKKALQSHGLSCSSISATLSPGRDLISPDGKVRENTKKYIMRCIEIARDLDSEIVQGPMYSTTGKLETRLPREKEWKYCIKGLRELGRFAEDYEVYLTIEPLNRFKSYFINTTEDVVKIIKEVNSPNVKINLDTFHMNIEEKSISKAISLAGELLYHVHVIENDRGAVGTGSINWKEFRDALLEIDYTHWLAIESFNPKIKSLAKASSTWKQAEVDQDSLARKSLMFLRQLFR